jgi:PAS domain S-box-containing protein
MISKTLPIGFYVVDAGRIIFFNERFCEIWNLGELKDRMTDGTVTNHDVAPEIVRQIAGRRAASSDSIADSYSRNAETEDLILADGRFIRHISSGIPSGNGTRLGQLHMFEDITELALARESIRKGHQRYKELADALPQIVFEMDLKGNLIFVNRSACDIMGFTEEDMYSGLNAVAMVAPEDRARAAANIGAGTGGGLTGNEYTFIRKDGSRMPVIVNSRPIRRDDRVIGLRGVAVDITERKLIEERLRKSVQEKEALLNEVHYRVRSSLQAISSLLSLQMAYADDFAALGLLRESQSRVRTITLVHEKLYGSCEQARAGFNGFAATLVAQVAEACRVSPDRYRLTVEGDDIRLEPDEAVPCGLIIGELIADSMSRAVEEGRIDELRIIAYGGDRIAITLEDNSTQAPVLPALGEPLPMSMQLVSMLVEQLEGTIRREGSAGMKVHIEFPAKSRRA